MPCFCALCLLLGFWVQVAGCRMEGGGWKVEGKGWRVEGLGLAVSATMLCFLCPVPPFGIGV